MSAKKTYQELLQRMMEIQEEMKTQARAAFQEGVQEFFANNPEVRFFSWTQYTPYFNDGDPCEFSVHRDADAIRVGWQGSVEEEEGYIPSHSDGKDYWDFEESEWAEKQPIYEQVSGLLYAISEDDMKSLFGDHVEVVVTPDQMIVEGGYSHD